MQKCTPLPRSRHLDDAPPREHLRVDDAAAIALGPVRRHETVASPVPVQAYMSLPAGSGMARPSARAVSIHSSMTRSAFFTAS